MLQQCSLYDQLRIFFTMITLEPCLFHSHSVFQRNEERFPLKVFWRYDPRDGRHSATPEPWSEAAPVANEPAPAAEQPQPADQAAATNNRNLR